MDDLDLDKIDLSDLNLDNPSSSAPTTNVSTQNPDGRPRLRKIKRPKQHHGPISTSSSASTSAASGGFSSASDQPETVSGFRRAAPAQPSQTAGTDNPSYSQTIRTPSYVRSSMPNTPTKPAAQPEPAAYDDSSTQNNPAGGSQGSLIRAGAQTPEFNNYINQNYNDPYAAETGEDDYAYSDNNYGTVIEMKKVVWIAVACAIFGVLLGKFMFSSEQVVRDGLQGVVVNPEVPKGRTRCGVAEKTQGCVLYIMNPQRQELNGRDFYDLAAQLTGRQRFVVETGNMRYSGVKIKPGNIAQLNIPPLQ